ncbi:speckle-type POZ protein [Trichonephila clavipes]|nr:speckle-type POZ protein [Trichonephila clavipes]
MQWSIENNNYFWHNKGKRYLSRKFSATVMENTKWRLTLYPGTEKNESSIVCRLRREEDEGPENIVLNYYLAVLGKDDSVLKNKYMSKVTFGKKNYSGSPEFVDKKLELERDMILSLNTLTVFCRIAWNDKRCIESEHICAKTIINIEKISFKWAVQEFNSLKPYQRIPFTLESTSKAILMSFSLFLRKTQPSDERIFIDVTCASRNFDFCIFKMFLVDDVGRMNECSQRVFWKGIPEKH